MGVDDTDLDALAKLINNGLAEAFNTWGEEQELAPMD